MTINRSVTLGLTIIVLVQAVLLAPSIIDILTPQTVEAAEVPTLTLGENGLPVGAVVFTLADSTCIALPNGAIECVCPCDAGCEVEAVECPTCDNAEAVAPSVSGSTVYTASVAGTLRTYDNPHTALDAAPDNPTTVDDNPPSDAPVVVVDNPPDHDKPKGNNGLGNGIDNPPPGIAKQGKPQNDAPTAVPGNPQYKGKGSDGTPNGQDHDKGNKGKGSDKGKGK